MMTGIEGSAGLRCYTCTNGPVYIEPAFGICELGWKGHMCQSPESEAFHVSSPAIVVLCFQSLKCLSDNIGLRVLITRASRLFAWKE